MAAVSGYLLGFGELCCPVLAKWLDQIPAWSMVMRTEYDRPYTQDLPKELGLMCGVYLSIYN